MQEGAGHGLCNAVMTWKKLFVNLEVVDLMERVTVQTDDGWVCNGLNDVFGIWLFFWLFRQRGCLQCQTERGGATNDWRVFSEND